MSVRRKFTPEEVIRIRLSAQEGVSILKLAKRYGIPYSTIYNIVRHITYKDVISLRCPEQSKFIDMRVLPVEQRRQVKAWKAEKLVREAYQALMETQVIPKPRGACEYLVLALEALKEGNL